MYGPAVRRKRFPRSGGFAVLHQCIRPLVGAVCAPGHHGYQRACVLITGMRFEAEQWSGRIRRGKIAIDWRLGIPRSTDGSLFWCWSLPSRTWGGGAMGAIVIGTGHLDASE